MQGNKEGSYGETAQGGAKGKWYDRKVGCSQGCWVCAWLLDQGEHGGQLWDLKLLDRELTVLGKEVESMRLQM